MAKDNHVYGFNKADAESLTTFIGQADGEYIEGKVRSPGTSGQIAVFVTPSGGIAARSGATLGSATCDRYTVTGGTRASAGTTATVYNDFTNPIVGNTDIIAGKIDGIWVAISEDCA